MKCKLKNGWRLAAVFILTVALFLAASFPDSVLRAENTCDHAWELKVSAANGAIPSSVFYECTKCHEIKDRVYGRSDHALSLGSAPLQAISYGGKQVLGVTLGQIPLSHPKTVYNLISFEKRTKGTDGSGNPVMQEISTQAVESACNTTDTVTAPEGYTPLSDLQFAAGSGGSRFAFSFAPLFNLHYNTNGADSGSPERASDTVSLWKSWSLAGAGSMTKERHAFRGWNTAPDQTTVNFTADMLLNGTAPNAPEEPGQAIELYPVWERTVSIVTFSATNRNVTHFTITRNGSVRRVEVMDGGVPVEIKPGDKIKVFCSDMKWWSYSDKNEYICPPGANTPYYRDRAVCTVPDDFSGDGTLSITWSSMDSANQPRDYCIVRGGSCANWQFTPTD